MIWASKPDISAINSFSEKCLPGHLGIEITEIGDDFIKATMPVDQRTTQPFGFLHGGASVVLAETIGSFASFLTLKNPAFGSAFGLEINANHLKSVREGFVTGIVTPIRIGKSIHVWDIKIYNNTNDLVCISRLTTKVNDKVS